MNIMTAVLLLAYLVFAVFATKFYWSECETILGKVSGTIIVFVLTVLVALAAIIAVYPNDEINIEEDNQRTITVYTDNWEVIAQYTGEIDIEGNDGGYVLFDYDGKRYTYYNCFVESVAEIE